MRNLISYSNWKLKPIYSLFLYIGRELINSFTIEDLNNLQKSILNNDAIHQEAAEAINELLKNNAEVLLDAQVLKCLHETVSKVFKCNTDFNNAIYISALVSQ